MRLWYPYLFAKAGEERGNMAVVDMSSPGDSMSNPGDMEKIGAEIKKGYVYGGKSFPTVLAL